MAVNNIPAEPASEAKLATGLLYFLTNTSGDTDDLLANAFGTYGKLAVAPLDALDKVYYSAELSCARVYFGGHNGLCLAWDDTVNPSLKRDLGRFMMARFTGYSAVIFNEQFQPAGKIKLNGLPNRVRISPKGHVAAITVFISGESYASLRFSTRTTIVDLVTGKVLIDLETLSVTRNGAVLQSPDFNYWGVTFTHDENRFYATLWSKGRAYLVEFDLSKHTAKVIYDGVECPSLSPDNMRIAFKKRFDAIGAPITWRISLLDLRSLTDTPLGETRSVDDQVEWLDNDHVLYALPRNLGSSRANMDIWVLPAVVDGSPRLLMRDAFSPAVVRGAK